MRLAKLLLHPRDLSGVEARIRGEGKEKRFVGEQVIQNASIEARVGGGGSQIMRAKPGDRKEPLEAFAVGRQEIQGGDGYRPGRIRACG
jgi:hypothetical protein